MSSRNLLLVMHDASIIPDLNSAQILRNLIKLLLICLVCLNVSLLAHWRGFLWSWHSPLVFHLLLYRDHWVVVKLEERIGGSIACHMLLDLLWIPLYSSNLVSLRRRRLLCRSRLSNVCLHISWIGSWSLCWGYKVGHRTLAIILCHLCLLVFTVAEDVQPGVDYLMVIRLISFVVQLNLQPSAFPWNRCLVTPLTT